jgi:hypothetical protein
MITTTSGGAFNQTPVIVEHIKECRFEQEILNQAVKCYQNINASHREIIKSKFELGEIVYNIIHSQKYGDDAVTKLAIEISKALKRNVLPQRLYESARLYDTFDKNIDKIWKLEEQMGISLTYTFLLRKCIPYINENNAWTAEELSLYVENKLNNWEKTVDDIERNAPKMQNMSVPVDTAISYNIDDDEINEITQQVEGFNVAFNQNHGISRMSFVNHLKKFMLSVDLLVAKNIVLTQKEADMIDDLMVKMMRIVSNIKNNANKKDLS